MAYSRISRPPAAPRLLLLLAAFLSACGPPDGDGRDPVGAGESDTVTVVFTIAEPDLLPENVAHDPVTGAYFVGSTRKGKILRVLDGEVSEFKAARADGLWMVIGMKVDAERRVLWVCSTQGENLVGESVGDGRAAGLFRFDLETGTLLDRWVMDTPGEAHFLNDVVIAADGTAYVTHMFEEPGVWVAAPGGDLEPYAALPERSYPNGITLSADGSALYVATAHGVLRIDQSDRSIQTLAGPEPERTTGIDGLYATSDALIGVLPDRDAVLRFDLESGGRAISTITTLVESHPAFRGPTTGVIVDDALHFIANAQFDMVSADGSLPAMSELADPVVLAVRLRACGSMQTGSRRTPSSPCSVHRSL